VTTFDMLATSDRDLFTVCKPSLLDSVCKDGDIVAREDCLESRAAAYGQLHSPRMRRSWLIANGCPEATVDAPPKPEALASATEAPPPAATSTSTSTKPEPPPASTKPEPPPAQADVSPLPKSDRPPPPAPEPPPPATAVAVVERPPPAKVEAPPPKVEAPPPARDEPPPAPQPEPPPQPAPALVAADRPPPPLAKASLPPPAPAAPRAPPAPSAGAFPARERGELRERRLRDIIIAHGREMKTCVERQLKLMPDLRADGMLVIEVDANGMVPHTELLGADLAGTPLETCLRTVASRWRFPSSGRAYRIDAPVKVSGSGR
jgi:hypothetical protein